MTGWQDDPIVGARPRWESDPIIVADPPAQAAATPAIELNVDLPVPRILQPSANPYSAGLYPLARKYTIGDQASFRMSDTLTGLETRTYTPRVTRVDDEAGRVEINDGNEIWDMMGNVIKAGNSVFDPPRQFSPAELQVGKKWTAAWKWTENGQVRFIWVDFQIVSRELVSVPAGSFHAFRVEGYGGDKFQGGKIRLTNWLVPGLMVGVKRDWVDRDRWGNLTRTQRLELVSLRQQVVNL